jgi:hypothetical protein
VRRLLSSLIHIKKWNLKGARTAGRSWL